ncbi:fatty acid metabolism transcriptional regulator FadR [Saccharobesus litoralis]|uniref:Fatty acid metabolism regulator protein n=1 Tax=Saccharobesus litoralis TaxID=2172099 RepID=A0A2S0VTN9_9ALTE|nr:fatty acid metabolism transcriptional regulator FadR [Saccharobesus litoralis]AWB67575.1 fatty acid metabolism transcriptional regulator FadR [Saccharobesus litoralis]
MFIKAQSPAGFAEEYLVESIWNGKFPPGSILPAERELSELIGVTRTTLREVLQRLARDGWLTIQHGKPTKVNNFWETSGLNILETLVRLDQDGAATMIDNLLAARTDVCSIVIRQAIKHDAAKCIEAFADFQNVEDNGTAYAEFDYRLLHTLAEIAGNKIYLLILNGFKGLYSKIGSFYFSHPEARALCRCYYKDIVQLAEAGDHELVSALVRKHGRESGDIFNNHREQMQPIN